MIRNYFKIAWRNLLRSRTLSVIKILSLGIGLTTCMLITLYTKDEITYDQFHERKTQLYRVTRTFKMADNPGQLTGITNAVLGETFAREIPEVRQSVRVNGITATVKKGNELFTENPLAVDENFFSVFTFPLLRGDATAPLAHPDAVVLSENAARKYFGTSDALGQTLEIKLANAFGQFTVSAIMENPPENSSLKPSIVLPFNYAEKYNSNQGWLGGSVHTFVLLSSTADTKKVGRKMQSIFDLHADEELRAMAFARGYSPEITLGLQPLTQIHLSTTEVEAGNGLVDRSNPIYSYVLTCIAVFILCIACINFVNLSLGQSMRRSREVGVRKVVGGTRKQLIAQFLTESFLVSLVAFILSLSLTWLTLPFFNDLAGKKLSLSYLSDGYLWGAYLLLLLVTAFFSGIYPSFILSAFNPVKSLSGGRRAGISNGFTKSLIVLQFSLTVILVIGTITIYTQVHYMLHTDLGYNSENLVKIDVPVSQTSDALPAAFRNELAHERRVVNVAAKNGGRSITSVRAEGKSIEIENNRIDDRFLSAFEIPLIAGRDFSPDHPSDTLSAAIVNERFVREAGWEPVGAIGKRVTFVRNGKPVTIVGVVRDYHFLSLKEEIRPGLFSMDPAFNYGQLWVKISPDDIPETLALLERTYKTLIPYFPYSYRFMEDINAGQYEAESKWKQMIGIAAVLFMLISCTGLLGLATLTLERRTKEIGIRKVLGATVSGIASLLSRDFFKPVLIAMLIAVPIAWWVMNEWLENFAYRIDIRWWMFVLAGLATVAMALFTVSFQAIGAAVANPVESLRTE